MDHPDLSAPTTPCSYRGEPWPLTAIMVKNLLLGLCTLQLYNLWGQVRLRRYLWPNLYVGDEPLAWAGDLESQRQVASLTGWGIVAFWLTTRSIHVLGLMTWGLGLPGWLTVAEFSAGLVLGSVASYHSARYQLRNTQWRNSCFDLSGDSGTYARIYLWGLLIAVATFGVGYGYFAVTTRRYLIGHTSWGGHKAQYTGTEAEARHLYVYGGLASIFSLGAYLPWHMAKLRRYHAEKTSLGPLRLQVHQEGSTLSNLWVVNGLLYIFTLGLGVGYASTRSIAYQMQHLRIEGLTNAFAPVPPSGPGHDPTAGIAPHEGLVDALSPGPYTFYGA